MVYHVKEKKMLLYSDTPFDCLRCLLIPVCELSFLTSIPKLYVCVRSEWFSKETAILAAATAATAIGIADSNIQQCKERLFYYANALMRFLAALDFTSVQ